MKIIYSMVLLVMIIITYWYINDRIDNTGTDIPDFKLDITQEKLDINKLENMNAYDAIVERPLFVEEREFKKEEKKKVERKVKPVVQRLDIKALGVAVTNESILAVVKDLKSGKIKRMNVGDEIEGWTLKGVSDDGFSFEKNGKHKLVEFKNN